jgi:hypothetical protein
MHHADSQPTGKKILVLRTRLRPVREQIATRPQPTPNPDPKPSENRTSHPKSTPRPSLDELDPSAADAPRGARLIGSMFPANDRPIARKPCPQAPPGDPIKKLKDTDAAGRRCRHRLRREGARMLTSATGGRDGRGGGGRVRRLVRRASAWGPRTGAA